MKKKSWVSVIIPVFNEEETVSVVIDRCAKQKIIKELVVINDGSTDNSKAIIDKLSKKYNKVPIYAINHKVNLGKGAAIKSGLKKVSSRYVIVQDADLEYFPNEIVKLAERAEKSKDHIVFGRRVFYKKRGYLLARIGNAYLKVLFFILFGCKLKDPYTCYKLIPRKIWLQLDLTANGFEIDTEIIGKLEIRKYEIVEEPISYNPRKFSEGKKVTWVDVIKATLTALSLRLNY